MEIVGLMILAGLLLVFNSILVFLASKYMQNFKLRIGLEIDTSDCQENIDKFFKFLLHKLSIVFLALGLVVLSLAPVVGATILLTR